MGSKPKSIGEYLLDALYRRGVRHLFGIPGDFALNFFGIVERYRKLKLITLSHEPGLGFATDGFSRITRNLGAVAVTFGAGALNIVNPVACAYAEKSPLVVISGAPGMNERGKGILFHHQAKSIQSQRNIFREITAYQAILEDTETAAEEIEKALTIAMDLAEPVYIEIPRDRVLQACKTPSGPPFHLEEDSAASREAAREVAGRLQRAKRPVLMVGVEVRRFNLERQVVRLAERLRLPVVTSFMGRSSYPVNHPLFAGTYLGPAGNPRVMKMVESSDCLILLGVLFADTNMALRLSALNPGNLAHAISRHVSVGHHSYENVPLRLWVEDLQRAAKPGLLRLAKAPPLFPAMKPTQYFDNSTVTVESIIQAVNHLLAAKGDMPVVADNGDCLFASLDIPAKNLLASGYYATMGFAVPAALGVQLGNGQRPLVLVGDGAFQMTGAELSHAPRLGLNPIVIVFNNGSWEMLRTIQPEGKYFQLSPWDYAGLGRLWGGQGYRVESKAEMLQALFIAQASQDFAVLDVQLPLGETSSVLQNYLKRIRG